MTRSLSIGAAALLAATTLCPQDTSAVTLYSAAGPDPAAIQGVVDDFRNALGDLNPFTPESFADGRRQINWDAAPAPISSPNPFPGDFFNFGASPRARGIEFSTPGSGFALSGDVDDGTPVRFANLNPTYEDEFQAFSEERLFTPRGSNITRVDFFSPEDQTTPAVTDGFGAVFTDVDIEGPTMLQYYDTAGNRLLTQIVPAADKGLSFAGAKFDDNILSWVRITTGNFDIGVTDGEFGYDVVAMDDFIFGEPSVIPEPATIGIALVGLTSVLLRTRDRSA